MKRRAVFLAVIGSLALGTACLTTPSVRQNEEISQRLHKDMADFYDNMSQAYYLLGYEYYKLYQEALDAKNEEAAKQYLNNARIYKQYFEDLKTYVDLMRKEYGLSKPAARPPATDESKAPTAIPISNEAITSRTEAVPIGPVAPKKPVEQRRAVQSESSSALPPAASETTAVEQKPGLLKRLLPWGKKSETKENK
jgi:hypothetical protein